MQVNLLVILVAILVIYVAVQIVIKSIDEKQLLEELVEQSTKHPDKSQKFMDVFLQKKTKIMFIKAIITSLLTCGFLKWYLEGKDISSLSLGSVLQGGTAPVAKGTMYGGCACDNPMTLPF